MKNSIGTNVILTVFGESHGEAVGAVLDGLAPGIEADEELIRTQLNKRRPSGSGETSRREEDRFRIISGIFNGRTTGAPICIIIENNDVRSSDYEQIRTLPRPSHADYTAQVKYCGFQDYRGGGHFSGRVTAGIAAVGAITLKALQTKGIHISTHILRCGKAEDLPFRDIDTEIKALAGKDFPVIDDNAAEKMKDEIDNARRADDSIGGILQTAVLGLPAGIGEPWFDSLEGMISKAVFALGGVKGIEFGAGFLFAQMRGSQANDSFRTEGGKIFTTTNNSGGINGGISNGMPILFNTAVKPTPSIAQKQDTVDFTTGENATLEIKGRHDPAIIRRICPVINSIVSIVICDALSMHLGTDFLKG